MIKQLKNNQKTEKKKINNDENFLKHSVIPVNVVVIFKAFRIKPAILSTEKKLLSSNG